MAWHQLTGKANGLLQDVAWWATISPFCVGGDLSALGAPSHRPIHLGAEADQSPLTELFGRLWAFRNRLRLARSLLILARALVICGLILVLAKAVQVLWQHPMSGWLPLILFLVLGWSFHLAVHHRIPSFEVARLVDQRAALQAQLATAVEYTASRRAEAPLAKSQVRLATVRLRELEPSRVVPLIWPGREARILAAMVALYAGLSVVGSLGLTLPRSPQAIDTELAKLASQDAQAPTAYVTVDSTQAQIQSTTATDQVSPQLKALQQQLADHAITPAQYQSQLQQLQQQLQAQATQSLAEQQALNALASALKDSSATHQISDSLARGDYQQAATQLDSLSSQVGQLSSDAQAELASRLAQAAAQTKQADQAMSQSAQQASDALRGGDNAQASKSLQSLAQSVQQASSQIDTQAQLGQALQDVQQGMGNNQSPQQSGSDAQNGSSSAQSASAVVTPGSQPAAAGQNGTQADSQGGLDRQSDTGSTATSQPGGASGQSGAGASGQQIAQQQSSNAGGAGSGPGSSALDSHPTPLDIGGVKLTITGQASDNGNNQTQAGDRSDPLTSSNGSAISAAGSGGTASSNVPINVHQESNVVPLEMKPVVREYFSNAGS
ncbi:MAG: hypothetical protein ACRDIY_13130 [Chloroflexota bacterium]